MRLRLFGATGEVTGSCFLVETSKARVLVEFGMFQGGMLAERKNRRIPPIRAQHLDAVVVTHAHLDHTGRLPLLVGLGYTGKIHATEATIDLTELILADSAQIQAMDAEWYSRRRERGGRGPVSPLYTGRDVEAVMRMFEPIAYDEHRQIAPGIMIRMVDAGHILGSASIEMIIEDEGERRVVVFSGDIGPSGVPIMRDPARLDHADVVLLESTYGDRDHRSLSETVAEFEAIIKGAAWEKEKVLIPSFAVGRTQSLIYHLGELNRNHRVPSIPVYLDSPMGISATELYRRHKHLFDEDARILIERGEAPLDIPDLHYTRTAEESRKLNDIWGAAVILAGSGMSTGGRILHHYKHNLWRQNVQVVIVGYQSEGTLGRRLVNGEKRVRVLGEWIAVRAKVHTLGGFSAHAGLHDLLLWAEPLAKGRPRFVLTHGEDRQRASLAKELESRFGAAVERPSNGQVLTL